jgi:hypothetical protein
MTVGDRLRSEGYLVDYAADGDEGFEKVTLLPFGSPRKLTAWTF